MPGCPGPLLGPDAWVPFQGTQTPGGLHTWVPSWDQDAWGPSQGPRHMDSLQAAWKPGFPPGIGAPRHLGSLTSVGGLDAWVCRLTWPLAGGRLLLRLGDREVEYSPAFRLYLTTKLSNPHYAPETAARAAIVNFAVKEQVGVGLMGWGWG